MEATTGSRSTLGRCRFHVQAFDAIVIGEPQRAFYGNQFGLTFPILTHYGVGLGFPKSVARSTRVRGARHGDDLFGGMSKGERTRVQLRVKASMFDLAERSDRFLAGVRPTATRLRTSALTQTRARPLWANGRTSSFPTRSRHQSWPGSSTCLSGKARVCG